MSIIDTYQQNESTKVSIFSTCFLSTFYSQTFSQPSYVADLQNQPIY